MRLTVGGIANYIGTCQRNGLSFFMAMLTDFDQSALLSKPWP
jgi:hypothetical protein